MAKVPTDKETDAVQPKTPPDKETDVTPVPADSKIPNILPGVDPEQTPGIDHPPAEKNWHDPQHNPPSRPN